MEEKYNIEEYYKVISSKKKIDVTCTNDASMICNDCGVIFLNTNVDTIFFRAVSEYFSMLFNELGLPCGDVDAIFVLTPDTPNIDELKVKMNSRDLAASVTNDNIPVPIYDFTHQITNTILPYGSIIQKKSGRFSEDESLEWQYVGDVSIIESIVREAFYAASRVTFQLFFLRELFGYVTEKELVDTFSRYPEQLYTRAKELFDGFLIDYVDFPCTKEELSDLMEYLTFITNHKDDFSPLPSTPAAALLSCPEDYKEHGRKLIDAGKLVSNAITIWKMYLGTSGSGLVLPYSVVRTMEPPDKPLINPHVRRQIAEITGISSAIDAIVHGVPIDDLLA